MRAGDHVALHQEVARQVDEGSQSGLREAAIDFEARLWDLQTAHGAAPDPPPSVIRGRYPHEQLTMWSRGVATAERFEATFLLADVELRARNPRGHRAIYEQTIGYLVDSLLMSFHRDETAPARMFRLDTPPDVLGAAYTILFRVQGRMVRDAHRRSRHLYWHQEHDDGISLHNMALWGKDDSAGCGCSPAPRAAA